MNYKYILKIFIFVIIIFSIIIFINSLHLNLNYKEPPKKLLQVVTIEGLKNIDSNIILPSAKSDSFCEIHRGSSGELDNSCGKLTKNNCNSTSCCVWTSENKCLAGGVQGPTFNTDSNGITKKLDYYYFQNKCYGDKCRN
jgi:hypothetical protein